MPSTVLVRGTAAGSKTTSTTHDYGSCRTSHLTRCMLHIARYVAYCTVTACHGATAASASQRSPCRRCPRSDAARRPAARLISRLFSIWFRHFNNFRTWSAVPVPNGTWQGYPQRGNRTTRSFPSLKSSGRHATICTIDAAALAKAESTNTPEYYNTARASAPRQAEAEAALSRCRSRACACAHRGLAGFASQLNPASRKRA